LTLIKTQPNLDCGSQLLLYSGGAQLHFTAAQLLLILWLNFICLGFFLLQKTLEAFTIILSFFQLLYLLSLHSGILGPKYGPTYNNNNNGVGPKSGDYGTPVATAV
jgi:hypothetical protein